MLFNCLLCAFSNQNICDSRQTELRICIVGLQLTVAALVPYPVLLARKLRPLLKCVCNYYISLQMRPMWTRIYKHQLHFHFTVHKAHRITQNPVSGNFRLEKFFPGVCVVMRFDTEGVLVHFCEVSNTWITQKAAYPMLCSVVPSKTKRYNRFTWRSILKSMHTIWLEETCCLFFPVNWYLVSVLCASGHVNLYSNIRSGKT